MGKEKGSKHHSQEFKTFITKQVIQDERIMTELSRTLDIPYGTIKNWVRDLRKGARISY